MWKPEMRFAERLPARIHGYHRSFCLYSPEYRGTRDKPGLVLGLDRGGSCRGIAYRLAEATLAAEIDLIWTREMTGFVYHMTALKIATERGPVQGYAFTVRRDYLANTVRHLEELGIADGALHRIEKLVQAIG